MGRAGGRAGISRLSYIVLTVRDSLIEGLCNIMFLMVQCCMED